jgi:aconitate hydratase
VAQKRAARLVVRDGPAPSGRACRARPRAWNDRASTIPLVTFAGRDSGMGSSRDWAAVAKRTGDHCRELRARPLMFRNGDTADSLGMTCDEVFDATPLADLKPRQDATKNGVSRGLASQCRVDAPVGIEKYENGEMLQIVPRGILERSEGEVKA